VSGGIIASVNVEDSAYAAMPLADVDLEGRLGAEPHETGLSRRSNALDPGFHGVPAGPAHPES